VEVFYFEQSASEVPADDSWLSARELIRMEALHIPKRHAEWRLGRWTAKRAINAYLGVPATPANLANVELRPLPGGAPQAFVAGQFEPVKISLSHRAGFALCAVSPAAVAMGCDLEILEPHSEAFVRDFFTPDEQALISKAPEADRLWLVPVLWSAKESALKALGEGLRMDTRSTSVRVGRQNAPDAWNPLQVECEAGETFYGWWRISGALARTIVASPASDIPEPLAAAAREQFQW
jgi:4'-phosphopantetheinyl transferase